MKQGSAIIKIMRGRKRINATIIQQKKNLRKQKIHKGHWLF